MLEGKWCKCGSEALGPTNQTRRRVSAGRDFLGLHQGLAMCFLVGGGVGVELGGGRGGGGDQEWEGSAGKPLCTSRFPPPLISPDSVE